jgi:hypothetical protein
MGATRREGRATVAGCTRPTNWILGRSLGSVVQKTADFGLEVPAYTIDTLTRQLPRPG